jgi:hypothetical protein
MICAHCTYSVFYFAHSLLKCSIVSEIYTISPIVYANPPIYEYNKRLSGPDAKVCISNHHMNAQ